METIIFSFIVEYSSDYIITYAGFKTINPLLSIYLKKILNNVFNKLILNENIKAYDFFIFRKIKNKKSNYKYMIKKFLDLVNSLYWETSCYLEHRENQKRKKRDLKKFKVEQSKKRYEDEKRRNRLQKKGFIECKCCKKYISSSILYDVIKDKTEEDHHNIFMMLRCSECNKEVENEKLQNILNHHGVEGVKDYLRYFMEKHEFEYNLKKLNYENNNMLLLNEN